LVSPCLTTFVNFAFDSGHGVAALFADNLAGEPTSTIADAVANLL